MQSQNTVNSINPVSFTISPSTPVETKINLLLTTSTFATEMSKDTVSIIVGYPEFIFVDTTDNPLVLWTINATPVIPTWEATTSTFYSSPSCYTDSKTGDYADNANVTMTLTNPIDLTGYSNPKLSFLTKYDIESNWDYGQVEISTNNGSAWIQLAGNYTNFGTGSFQPNEPLYDGSQSNWVREEMSLSGYNSNQVKLRFKLISDGAVQRDGWYLDDIGIIVYSAVPVELISFTAKVEQSKVMLEWETATETNNYGFELERSLTPPLSKGEGVSEWAKIGFVNGNGTTEEIKLYSFVDKNLKQGQYLYRLKQINMDGSYKYSNEVEVQIQPGKYSLEQNYPNPFNPSTKITYSIPAVGTSVGTSLMKFLQFVQLKVYDVLGNEVATLVEEYREAGRYEITFNASDLASGMYLYILKAGDFVETKKMILVR